VSGSADREHFDSLGSRTDLLDRTSVFDVGVSIGPVLPERVLHGVLVSVVRPGIQRQSVFSLKLICDFLLLNLHYCIIASKGLKAWVAPGTWIMCCYRLCTTSLLRRIKRPQH